MENWEIIILILNQEIFVIFTSFKYELLAMAMLSF